MNHTQQAEIENALALAATANGKGAITAGTGTRSTENSGGAIGPGATAVFEDASLALPAGAKRWLITANCTTTADAADRAVSYQLTRDTVPFGPIMNQDAGHVAFHGSASITFLDTPPSALGHTYGVVATAGAGTVTIPMDGVSITRLAVG